ncbi:MAG: Oxidoreductase, short chain dehydrogenase/reductase family protein [Myxococcales bacterium]|nr:Oxidoreductase, short chain dehydrogenase/reductase family protein [Myxococcales bacterium]
MPIPASARAVVTGAGSGLGRAFCHDLARRGAKVLCADIDEASAKKTADEIGHGAASTRCDVSKLEDVQALAVAAEALLGGVDLIVNNAGVAVGGLVGEISIEDWRWIVGVNFWGVVHGCHVFAPILKKQGRGHVLNVASAAGLLAPPSMGPYNATKAAVIALSETLRAEFHGTGAGVTVLCPTFFATNIHNNARGTDENMRSMVEQMMSASKLSAADVARMALDTCERDQLYALPHADGRWLWRLKRYTPAGFAALLPRAYAAQARRAGLTRP